MKHGRILSLSLLSLFLLSALTPMLLAKTDFSNVTVSTATIYKPTLSDIDGDKIEDKLMMEIQKENNYIVDVVVVFRHKITSIDLLKLTHAGAYLSNEIWGLGQRTKITTTVDNLENLANLDGVAMISSAQRRLIVVAIQGDDFSDLANLEIYPGAEIFWAIGCALIPYYSGVEYDLNLLGQYTLIADATDSYFYKDTIDNETTDIAINTIVTAGAINATSMWSMGYEGAGVKVGNIDTGINHNHDDYKTRIVDSKSFVTIEYGYTYDDLTTDDYNGHGSHTSGIIAGDGTVTAANKGVAPAVDICFAKIGDWKQTSAPATTVSILAALDWLVGTKQVKACNFSYGGSDRVGLDASEIAFGNAVRVNNVLCSISAGNSGADGFYTVGSPSTSDDVLSVGSLDTSYSPYSISYFSSKGLSADDHMKPDVLAPGASVTSCGMTGNSYATYSGTSMAAPHATGAIILLIDACISNGIPWNPGVIKAALMKTAVKMGSYDILLTGRGYINVGQAWNLIKKAPIVNGFPSIGACNPYESPIPFWYNLLQGQITEQYLTCVSPYKTNLTLELTGTAATYITYEPLTPQYSSIAKVTYSIPVDAPTGVVTGQIKFKYLENVLDTVNVVFNIAPSSGKRMLLNFRTTDYGIDHMFGQYRLFSQDILAHQYVLSEQNVYLDSGILDNYEAVWLPDPFNLLYPLSNQGIYNVSETYNPWTESEKSALTDYVENGGTVFLCFLGYTQSTISGYGTILTNTNVSTINDWTSQYGITVRDTIWTSPSTIIVNPMIEHALTAEVTGIDHYGTSLIISGDAVGVTRLAAESPYATSAYYQHPNGGRVIVMTTNFVLDTAGYINNYNYGGTQNDNFGRNLVRWALASNRIERNDVVTENETVTMSYSRITGSGTFGGYVILPDNTQQDLVWSEVSTNTWEAEFNCSISGTYKFYPECGATGEDEFDYFTYVYEAPETPTTTAAVLPIVIILISGFGLAAWLVIQRVRSK